MTVEDVRQLMGASTPHFALQLRNRIAALIADLPPSIRRGSKASARSSRLQRLGFEGETRGEGASWASARSPRSTSPVVHGDSSLERKTPAIARLRPMAAAGLA